MMIQVGDRVALKGRIYPVMLVTSVAGDTALCSWQLEGQQCSAGYPVADLVKTKEPARGNGTAGSDAARR